MATIRGTALKTWRSLLNALGCRPKTVPKPDTIDDFFIYGSQYYVAGRWGMFAALMPVAANLHHHAIEMLMKGALAKTMSTEDLRLKLGHRLPKAWKKLKK